MGISFSLLLLLLLVLLVGAVNGESRDSRALLSLKAEIDPSNSLQWDLHSSSRLCSSWQGIKQCNGYGRVTKLVLEYLNLTGTLKSETLAPLEQIRVLSFKSNSLSGPVPDLTPLYNLKSLYLNDNRFSGKIPSSLSSIHRLKIIVLSDNQLTGEIPASFAQIPRLYTLFLQNNSLSGQIPILKQQGLRFLNVSNNNLSGEIPHTKILSQFNLSSFLNNPNLCGAQIQKPCSKSPNFSPSTSPTPSVPSPITSSPQNPTPQHKNKKKLIKILVGSICGFILVAIVSCLLALLILKSKKKRRKKKDITSKSSGEEAAAAAAAAAAASDGGGAGVKMEFSWENEGLGKLVFCGGAGEMYSLEDLLKASAETLGRGTVGSTYKAVMESGFIVTVKRLKDSGDLGVDEFRRKMEELGRLRHSNLVPLRAYFQAKEERLLVYDYFPNGSLFSLIHGSRPSGSGKPLHWTSCLKIAEDVATGLLHLHQSGSVHGNLRSSNVLLGSDFESCLADYGLLPILRPAEDDSSAVTTTSSSALFHRAPECRGTKPTFTPRSDMYSFGFLLLELLTGKTPFQDLVEEHGADIPRWVRSVREEETESGGDESAEEKLGVLLNVAMACIVADAERRPATKEAVRMIKEARAEVVVSSNSSDHSPGRWSDTVQSLPREYGSEHLGFAERD